MSKEKEECPTARTLRITDETRWDRELVGRMFADLPFKPGAGEGARKQHRQAKGGKQ